MTPAIKRLLVAAGMAVVLAGSLLLNVSATAQSSAAHPLTGVKPPSERPPAARVINAEEMQGLLKRDGQRPLLVNYWATWCVPCRDEFPDLVKIDAKYRAKGLDFIAISLDDLADLETAVPKFLRTMKASMPVYLLNVADPEPAINSVDAQWGGSLPATFLYDNKGQVVYKRFGRIDTKELRAAIDKLVGRRQEQ